MATTTPVFYTPAQACEILGVSRRTLTKWIASRDIPYSRMGRQIRFTPEHLAKFAERTAVGTRRKGVEA